jgi:pyruvate dehydrogenase E2 component (dihydrolipoamide acetyltransferase)
MRKGIMGEHRSEQTPMAGERTMAFGPADRIEKFSYADRWLRDGLRVADQAGFFVSSEVDMSRCALRIAEQRAAGIRATYTHAVIRAVAVAFSRHPDLHQLISERKRLRPAQLDIGLSIAADTVVAPVLVIKNVAGKGLAEIAREVEERAPSVRKQHEEFLAWAGRWGWLVPLGVLRRLILRTLARQFWFRRQGAGTFQVSCLREVDQFVPFLFSTSAILAMGRVRDRAVVIEGKVEVRPTAILSCCVDHKAWDGAQAATFLREVAAALESGELEPRT